MKKLFLIGLVFVVALAGLLVFLGKKSQEYLTPERLATTLEEEINSRVHIGGVEVSLLSSPAKVVLKDVQIGVRDEEVAKPYAERGPMRGASVQIAEARLAVNLGGILRKRLAVKELSLREPKVTMMMFEDGRNSLDELFRSPDDEEEEEKEKVGEKEESEGETFHFSQLGVLASLEGIGWKDGEINVVIEKTGLSLRVEGFDVALNDLEVDSADIASLPAAEVNLSGELLVDSADQGEERYGRLGFAGTAQAKFFDPKSGDFALAAGADLQLDEGSYVGTNIPFVEKAWSALQKLEKIGAKIDPLPEKATFGRSESLAVQYDDGLVTLNKAISLVLDDWELAFREKTWVQTESEMHKARAELVADGDLSAKFRGQIDKGMGKVPKEIRPDLVAAVEGAWFADGRLRAVIVSEGELSKPSLDVVNKTPDLKEAAKDAAKRYAQEKLKGLLGR